MADSFNGVLQETGGGGGTPGTGVTQAQVIALIQSRTRLNDGVIPGEVGELPTPTEDNEHDIGWDTLKGDLRGQIVDRKAATAPQGDFSDYTNTDYHGVVTGFPTSFYNGVGSFVYNRNEQDFLELRQVGAFGESWLHARPSDVLESDEHFLGWHATKESALTAISNHDSSTMYVAYIHAEHKLQVLDNSTWVAGTAATVRRRWASVTGGLESRVHALEETLPVLKSYRLPDVTLTGADSVLLEFDLSAVKPYIDIDASHKVELILACTATFDSATVTAGSARLGLRFDATDFAYHLQALAGSSPLSFEADQEISDLASATDVAFQFEILSITPSTEDIVLSGIELFVVPVLGANTLSESEALDEDSTVTGGVSGDIIEKAIKKHETRPWSHTEVLEYKGTLGTGGYQFTFTTSGSSTYLQFNEGIEGEIIEDWVRDFETRDVVAMILASTKEEVWRAEINGEYDEDVDRGIEIINATEGYTFGENITYLLESTRGAPDVGQELPRIREEIQEAIPDWAKAKELLNGLFVDKSSQDPIPRDRRLANIPLPWRTEYLNARHYRDITDATSADTVLIFSVQNNSGDLSLQVDTANGLTDVSDLEAMKKHDVLVVEGTSGSFDGVILAMFQATVDWSDANGLALESIFYLETNTHFNYDGQSLPVNVYMTGAVAEIPEDGGGMQQGSNVTPTRSLILQTDDEAVWQDVLSNPQWDEIYKAGTTTTDYTERITATGTYSLKSGYDFRDYGMLAVMVDRSAWGRASLYLLPRNLVRRFTEGTNPFGDADDADSIGRLEIWAYWNLYLYLRFPSNNQLNLYFNSGLGIRAIWGMRQGE